MSQHIDAVAKQSGLETLNSKINGEDIGMLSEFPNLVGIKEGAIGFGLSSNVTIGNTTFPVGTRCVGYYKFSIAHVVAVASTGRTWILRCQSYNEWSILKDLASKSEITAFTALGATNGTTTNVEIQLPSNAMFTSSQPLFMIASFRGSTSNANEGYAILKIDQGVVYVTNKSGIQTLEDISYNSTTKKITFTSGTYMTFIIFGLALS